MCKHGCLPSWFGRGFHPLAPRRLISCFPYFPSQALYISEAPHRRGGAFVLHGVGCVPSALLSHKPCRIPRDPLVREAEFEERLNGAHVLRGGLRTYRLRRPEFANIDWPHWSNITYPLLFENALSLLRISLYFFCVFAAAYSENSALNA